MENKTKVSEAINNADSVKFNMYVGDDRINVSENEEFLKALFSGFKKKGFNVSVDTDSNSVVIDRHDTL